jgi:uncharacterized membrane protein
MALTDEEMVMIQHLREYDPAKRIPSHAKGTAGQLFADRITRLLGSWPFLLAQTAILIAWVALNVAAWIWHWDPYPFILLNLALSFQAAYAAPIILMSQNRENQIDRQKLDYTYHVEMKNELELELLHHKVDEVLKLLKER